MGGEIHCKTWISDVGTCIFLVIDYGTYKQYSDFPVRITVENAWLLAWVLVILGVVEHWEINSKVTLEGYIVEAEILTSGEWAFVKVLRSFNMK